jgi:hyperosmotically inducible periplasmic protein
LLAVALAACGAATVDTNDDATIATRVKIAMLDDPTLGPQRIDAHVFKGVVTLSGTVGSRQDEQHAIEIAKKMRGVRNVKSELRVAPNTTPTAHFPV